MQNNESLIILDANGVKTKDSKGNEYYRGVRLNNVAMTFRYFQIAQEFWKTQNVNGQPVELNKIQVMTAANSVVPYNAPSKKLVAPWESQVQMNNRIAWYTAEFIINGRAVKTPWLCHSLYETSFKASQSAASGVAYDFAYADSLHRGVHAALANKVKVR